MPTQSKISTNMLRPASASTRLTALTMLTLCLTGCEIAPSGPAICDATVALRTDHAAALFADGGQLSQRSGARLIATIDAGCGQ